MGRLLLGYSTGGQVHRCRPSGDRHTSVVELNACGSAQPLVVDKMPCSLYILIGMWLLGPEIFRSFIARSRTKWGRGPP